MFWTHRIKRTIERFRGDDGGAAAVMFTLMSIPLVLAAGGAVDISRLGNAQVEAQAKADAGAVALAKMPADSTQDQLAEVATAIGPAGAPSDCSVSPARSGRTVTVSVSCSVKTAFLGIVGIKTLSAEATSSAESYGDANSSVCVLALNKTADGALAFSGNADFVAENCWLQSNSASDKALSVQGSASVKAAGFCAVGKVYSSRTLSPAPQEGCAAAKDPYETIPRRTVSGCDFSSVSVKPKESKRLTPGTYCGGIDIKGDVVLDAGEYVIKDGALSVNGQGSISGSGVTLYLTGQGAGFTLNGGGALSLSARTTGDYKGLLIVQDRLSGVGGTNTLNGGAGATLVGAIYTPTQSLKVNGNGSLGQASPFMPLIADQILFSGSATVRAKTDQMEPVRPLPPPPGGIRLAR